MDRAVYEYILKKTGDPQLAQQMAESVVSTPGILSRLQNNPLGRFDGTAPEARNADPMNKDFISFNRDHVLPDFARSAAGMNPAFEVAGGAAQMATGDVAGGATRAAMGAFWPMKGRAKGKPFENTTTYNRALLNAWQKERPLGTPPGGSISPATLDQLRNGPRQRGLFDDVKSGQQSFDDASVGMTSGSGIREPKPKRNQSTRFSKSLQLDLLNAYKSHGNKLTLEQAKIMAPGVSEKRLKKTLEDLDKLVKEFPDADVVRLKELLPSGAGIGLGILGASAVSDGGEY
jgi:hypothetical protein